MFAANAECQLIVGVDFPGVLRPQGLRLGRAIADRRDDGQSWLGSTYDEGPVIPCDDCGEDMESSYGDPDEDQEDQRSHTLGGE